MTSTHRGLPFLLLLPACTSGSVTLDQLDPFGAAASAAWIHLDVDGVESHQFVVADVPDVCNRADDAAFDLAAALADREQALEAAGDDDVAVCDAETTFYDAARLATRSLFRRHGSFATFLFDDLEDDPEDPPNEGPYEVGDADDPTFVGWLTELADNPFEVAGDAGCADAALEVAYDDTVDRFAMASGRATVTLQRADLMRIDLSGELEDADGDPAGAIDVRARFERCDLDLDPEVAGLLLFPAVTAIDVDTDAPGDDTDPG